MLQVSDIKNDHSPPAGKAGHSITKGSCDFFDTTPVWQPRHIAARVVNATQSPLQRREDLCWFRK